MKYILLILLLITGLQAYTQDVTKIAEKDTVAKAKVTGELGLGLHLTSGKFSEHSRAGLSYNFSFRIKFKKALSVGLFYEQVSLISRSQRNENNIQSFRLQHIYLHSRYTTREGKLVPFFGFAVGVANYREPSFVHQSDLFNFVVRGEEARTVGFFLESGVYIYRHCTLLYRFCRGGKSAEFPTFLDNVSTTSIYTHYISIHFGF